MKVERFYTVELVCAVCGSSDLEELEVEYGSHFCGCFNCGHKGIAVESRE